MWKAVAILVVVVAAPASAATVTLPSTGSTRFAAYASCHQLSVIDMGEIGSDAVNECVGIAKNKSGVDVFDNTSVKCMERDETRAGKANYIGWCALTDVDGDKLFVSYEGGEGGKATFLGGAGKYKGMMGGGAWTVTDAPALVPGQFAFTLDFEMSWAIR